MDVYSKDKKSNNIYEILNSLSHGVGVILGVIFLILMIFKFANSNKCLYSGYIVYGISFILLFLASTIYHAIPFEKAKSVLRVFDHSAIFIFIAGSYTPIILKVLEGKNKIIFLAIIWSIAIAGFLFKLFTYGKYDKFKKISVILYLLMGWFAIFLIKPMLLNTSFKFIFLIVLGGVIYSIGTYFYKKSQALYNHIIWHLFVLAGSVCQFLAIYFYLA